MVPFTRSSLLLAVGALLAAIGLASLGLWQLSRASEKEATQAAIAAHGALPELTQRDLGAESVGPGMIHRQVRLRGRWLPEATVYLDNRPMAGRVGFIVVTPLQLEGEPRAILVQRGWIPRDTQDRTRLVPVSTPVDTVEIEGRLVSHLNAVFDLGSSSGSPGPIRQNIELDAYAAEIGASLVPLVVLQQGAAQDSLLREWAAPTVNVQKHYGYAFQWFAMSALVVSLYVWFQLFRSQRVTS